MTATQKTVLITGAARRLGRAIALELGAQGWAVCVHYRISKADAEETLALLRAKGAKAAAIACDLGDENEISELVTKARAALGPLTALVNNASVFEPDDIASMTPETWQRHIAINLRAPAILAQKFAEQLGPQESGAIVNITDQRMFKPTPDFLSYGVSKAGLHWLTTVLAQSLAPRIRVNAVAPGPTLPSPRQSEDHFRRQTASTPLKRGAKPEEIAAAVRYLLEAESVTGQTIAVDGGQHLAWRTADVADTE